MAGLGIAIAWFGYWVLYYGVTQIQGDNYGFLDLGVPGRWAKAAATPPDGAVGEGAVPEGPNGALNNPAPAPQPAGTATLPANSPGLNGANPPGITGAQTS